MTFREGNRVLVRATGARGTVTGRVAPGIVRVRLDEGMEIRIQESQLVPAASAAPRQRKGTGVWLGFVPEYGVQAWPDYYVVHLLNDTPQALDFRIALVIGGEEDSVWEDRVDAFQTHRLGKLYYDELNEGPAFTLQFWRSTTAGPEASRPIQMKIRPATFFKKKGTLPILEREGHLLEVRVDFGESQEEDLRQYTRQRAMSPRQRRIMEELYSDFETVPDPRDLASFEPEIDLHIEKLTPDHKKMSNAEILRLQLSRMEAFLEKAVRLGIERVFLIHGVGKGRLRDEIATRLIQHPHVVTFRNDYHPRYGMGATEVILKKEND
ncbi:MAG: hypothetical protein D6818_01520 [Bacteroidetes bacterium]|nr:MAG: hypothetical protein D6818_01520 [Bacteroidota bacterium]